MTMRLRDLTKDVSTMSEEELIEHVRGIRHNKYVAKPAVAKRVADVEKKEKNKAVRKTDDLIDAMSEADRLALIKLLEGDNG
jgi:uncharacterized tellurite resistance protein B-like protein